MNLKKSHNGKVKKYAVGGIIAGGAQTLAGIGQTIYGARQLKKANQQMDKLLKEAPKLELPSAYNQYVQKAMDETALKRQTDAINQRLATSTQALSQAGGRALLGGLQSAVAQATQSQQAAEEAQTQREMGALQVLGGAQQNLQGMKEQRFQMQYGEAAGAKNAAMANIGAGIGAAAGGAAAFGATAAQNQEDGLSWWGTAKDGMKTKGEFSHKNNPLSLVDKQGNVVGEATGGEYILNPKQAKAISKESKYFRNLLKKKRFK
jgi:hypothetical protein